MSPHLSSPSANLLSTTATLTHLDVTYGQTHQAAMETLVRDICNPDAADPGEY